MTTRSLSETWLEKLRRVPQLASEKEAVRLCKEALDPFCSKLVLEPELTCGLRPDIGFRLKSLPNLPLVLECKNFNIEGFGATLADSIGQAADYAARLKTKAFVGPLYGRQAKDFHWADSPPGAMCLVAAQFNVGFLLTSGAGRDRITVLLLAQAPVATLTFNEYGDASCRLHSDAANLLAYKERAGSSTWRKA